MVPSTVRTIASRVKVAPNSRTNRRTAASCACGIGLSYVSALVVVIAMRCSFDAKCAHSHCPQHRDPPEPAIEAKDRSRGPKALTCRDVLAIEWHSDEMNGDGDECHSITRGHEQRSRALPRID